MKQGKFITLDGGEGLGKSTNLTFIQNTLEARGISICITREPGGTVLAEKLRHLLLETKAEAITEQTELLLMFAARAQHLHHVIKPALAQGQWVLCDRFTDATYAYQGGGRKMNLDSIAWLEQFVQQGLEPDLTLLFDAPVELGIERAKKRAVLDRFESEQLSFFNAVRKMYLLQAEKHPQRIKVINAAQSLDAVQTELSKLVKNLL